MKFGDILRSDYEDMAQNRKAQDDDLQVKVIFQDHCYSKFEHTWDIQDVKI